ncbi:MAG: diphthamide synthesis protein [Candidatus Paceibacterota bacterium]
MEYSLDIEKAIAEIKKQKAKLVCLQFPEGLKPRALKVADEIEGKTGAKCVIWLGSCYGACDIPKIDADLLIQFGHSKWIYKKL